MRLNNQSGKEQRYNLNKDTDTDLRPCDEQQQRMARYKQSFALYQTKSGEKQCKGKSSPFASLNTKKQIVYHED